MHQTDQGIHVILCLLEMMNKLDIFPCHKGVFKRMIEEVRKYVLKMEKTDGLEKLDGRMKKLLRIGELQNFRMPTHRSIWQSGVGLQANEYRKIMQVSYMFRSLFLGSYL